MVTVEAISLDLWGTIYSGSQEVEKYRIELLLNFLIDKNISKEDLEYNYRRIRKEAKDSWRKLNIHTSCDEIIASLLQSLNISRDSFNEDELASIIYALESINLHHKPPTLYPEIQSALPILSQKFPIGIISDVGLTPGFVLREILKKDEIYNYISTFTFSDELKCTKPMSIMFETTAHSLGVDISKLLHVGDDIEKDYKGAIRSGASAIWLNRSQNFLKSDKFSDNKVTIKNLLELIEII